MEEDWDNYLKPHGDFSVNVTKEKVGNGAWIIQGVYFHWSKSQNNYLISLCLITHKFMILSYDTKKGKYGETTLKLTD